MDYEKKYKDLIEAIKVLKEANPSDEGIQNWIKDNVPELKESDDKRIKNNIIIALKSQGEELIDFYKTHNTSERELIDWIEKQGEKKPVVIIPKFKVGDWIKHNKTNFIFQISKVADDKYEFNNPDGYNHSLSIKSVDEKYHLWTIQDSKDGDVLVASDKSLFIYDGSINESGNVCFHIAFTEDMDIILNSDDGCGWEEKDSCHPATKEQRDTLMKAMADAGYTFDFEKKELRKIEHKLAWSEEDENYINDLIKYFSQNEKLENTKEDIVIWLKSLRPQNKWKPSEGQLEALRQAAFEPTKNWSEKLQSLYTDLKKL